MKNNNIRLVIDVSVDDQDISVVDGSAREAGRLLGEFAFLNKDAAQVITIAAASLLCEQGRITTDEFNEYAASAEEGGLDLYELLMERS